jgi:hypothetical protein
MELEKLFCEIDDFCQEFMTIFETRLISHKIKKRNKRTKLSVSEVMTIIIYFHHSNYRCFKHYYQQKIEKHHRCDFPELVSYQRFIELMPTTLIPLIFYLNTRKGCNTGISFIDSTRIPICHPKRYKSNRVFKELAGWGKSSMGWFFGFKLHLIINECGELLNFQITPGNVDDRVPVPSLTQKIFGKIFGDKGYISKELWKELWDNKLKLITPLKKNMKNKLLSLEEKLFLRKRSLIETVNDQLKNISQLVHSRHRSVANFMVNLIAALIAYTWQPKKPSLKLTKNDRESLGMVLT